MALKHAIIRLYLYFLLALFFLSGGLTLVLLAPLYKGAFAPMASYKDLKPFLIWCHIYRVVWRSITNKNYEAMYPQKLTDPPKLSNDRNIVRIKESWQGSEDNCDLCKLSCCAQITCPMLDNGRCLSYDSWYFGYLYCGRYPENQSQMDLYNCPKWEMRT